jgi:hypothetical protein
MKPWWNGEAVDEGGPNFVGWLFRGDALDSSCMDSGKVAFSSTTGCVSFSKMEIGLQVKD